MDLQKSNMTVLAQIVKLIPAKIIDFLAKKYKIQSRAFSPTSHVVSLLYEHLAHSLSLNDVCDSLQYHSGMLSQIRRCTPPTAKDSDPKTAPELCSGLKAGEIAVFDKVYVDFKHLNSLDKRGTFRVTRKKENMVYEVMGQHAISSNRDAAGDEQKVMGQHLKRPYNRKKIRIISDEKNQTDSAKYCQSLSTRTSVGNC